MCTATPKGAQGIPELSSDAVVLSMKVEECTLLGSAAWLEQVAQGVYFSRLKQPRQQETAQRLDGKVCRLFLYTQPLCQPLPQKHGV